jgi:hypothetical protein
MKTLFRSLSVAAVGAVALAFATGVHAQIVTFNTIVANNGSANINFTTGNNVALSQTFTNVAELNNLTYEFVENGVDSVDQTIQAYLVQWNTSNNSVMSNITLETTPNSAASDVTTALSTTPLSTFVVPPVSGDSYGTWSSLTYSGGGTYPAFTQTLNINQILDPSLTYAVVLIDTTNANGSLGLPSVVTVGNSFFGYGTGYQNFPTLNPYTSISSMEGSAGNYALSGPPDTSYGFSQIQLVPGTNIVPTPEPRTAAAILCALFVAVLVGRQLILRRRESDGAVAALAA